jgi:hypothetical protein
MFIALCRRYGLRPLSLSMRRHSVIVRAPEAFLNTVLAGIPGDQRGAGDADEVPEPAKIGR